MIENIFVNLIVQAYHVLDTLSSFFEGVKERVNFLTLIDWMFQLPYLIGMGVGVIIGLFSLNKLLVRLFMGHEVSTFGVVENPPKLSGKQIATLKESLYWWNRQCDRWYITEPSSVDKIYTARKINLVDVQRISDAIRHGDMFVKISKKDKAKFKLLDECLVKTERLLIDEINYKKTHAKVIDELDTLSKQLKITHYAAMAAIASAVATGVMAYMSYSEAINPCR